MANIAFGGLASGLDTNSIITQLVALERRSVQKIEAKKSDAETAIATYATVSTRLGNLQTLLEDMSEVKELGQLSIGSSDEDVLTAQSTGTATPGVFSIEVTKTAAFHKTMSNEVAAADQAGLFGEGTLSITVGSDAVVDLAVDATTTLADLKGQINNSGADVFASIVNTGSGFRLVVGSKETGSDEQITFGESGTLTLGLTDANNVLSVADDAEVIIDGKMTITSKTNTVSEAIEGVTLELKASDVGNPLTVTIARDMDAQVKKFQEFVDGYNSIVAYINAKVTPPKPGTTGGLINDSTLKSIKSTLAEKLRTVVSGLTFETTSTIGIKTERDGTISLNSEDLKGALSKDFSGVLNLFAQKNTGFADVMNSAIKSMVGLEGLLPSRKSSLDRSIRTLNDNIDSQNRRVSSYQARLVKQFTAMEQMVSQLNSQAGYLQSAFNTGR
jgi:flagellar hook-associated protein 2